MRLGSEGRPQDGGELLGQAGSGGGVVAAQERAEIGAEDHGGDGSGIDARTDCAAVDELT